MGDNDICLWVVYMTCPLELTCWGQSNETPHVLLTHQCSTLVAHLHQVGTVVATALTFPPTGRSRYTCQKGCHQHNESAENHCIETRVVGREERRGRKSKSDGDVHSWCRSGRCSLSRCQTYECIRIDYGGAGGRVCCLLFLRGESVLI